MAKTAKLVFSYEDTEFTRTYNLEAEDSISSGDCKAKILAINASLAAGTDGGLSDFFVSDIGERFVKISEARLIETTELPIAIGG